MYIGVQHFFLYDTHVPILSRDTINRNSSDIGFYRNQTRISRSADTKNEGIDMYIFICIYVYTCVYIYLYIYMYVCIHVHIFLSVESNPY
jgi:hypothetical protein